MAIKATRTQTKIEGINDTVSVSQVLNITGTKGVNICTYTLNYTLYYSLYDNEHKYIDFPLSQINSEIIMHSDDTYEVAECTTYSGDDISDIDKLIKANINVYKKPHKGWNYRLKGSIWLCVFNDGRVEHGCV